MAAFELRPGVAVDDGESIIPLHLAKAQCRVLDDDSEDDLIVLFRDAAIDLVQQVTGKQLSPTVINWSGSFDCGPLHLGAGPVSVVSEITYKDLSGVSQTLLPSDFIVGVHGRVHPVPLKSWPADAQPGSVNVTFTAGYTRQACPPALLQAALFMIGHFHNHREAVAIGSMAGEVPLSFMNACAPYRMPSIG